MLELRNMDSEPTPKSADRPKLQAAGFVMRSALFISILGYLAYKFRWC